MVVVPRVVLSIAGYDPCSGAGVTADIKTAAVFDCYAVTCITALTVQSTQGVFSVQPVASETVRDTLHRLRQDFEIAAVRIGMLGSAETAEEVAAFLERERLPNVVLDPIIRSSSGAQLIDDYGVEVLQRRLLPLADLITPNIEEAAILAELDPPSPGSSWADSNPRIRECTRQLHERGCAGVLVTGGHLAEAVDFLSVGYSYELRSPVPALVPHEIDAREHVFRGEHIQSRATHGTGCAFAMGIACLLAHERSVVDAVRQAKTFVQQAIERAYPLGKGTGPVNHLCRMEDRKLPQDELDTAS
jgi:hydroxymethylpyrimidine kinase/phosphomethylpyrimidine kinase